ncbi:MAG: hypothetical protein LBD08_08480, partial [Treponema sp.]|nr:hypothetical protein [Treponema sp.]
MNDDKYEQQERFIGVLKFRITLFFILFFMAVFGVFVVTSALEVNAVVHFIGSRLAVSAVKQAGTVIDGDAFEALSISLDKDDPFYEAARQRLWEIAERTGSAYLYTMAPVSDKIYRYIIDGSALPDDRRHFSPLGAEEDISIWEDVFAAALKTGTIQVGGIDQHEVWGPLISAYGPILNSSGKTVGVIGCDLDARAIVAWIRGRVVWQLGIAAGFVLIG